jgi:hypothetical protein
MKTLALCLVIVLCSGCSAFQGDRAVSFKWSGFGTSIEWQSDVSGTYADRTADAAAVETPPAK